MYCAKCGKENPSVSNYCFECGTALVVGTNKNDSSQPFNMKKPEVKTRIKPTLWNPTVGANWSLLLSPAFGAYMHMLNWQALGYNEKAKSSRNWFLVSLPLSLFGLGFFVLIAWYFSSAKEQIKYIKTHFGDNYPKRSWVKPLLIAIATTLIGLVLAITIPTLINQFDSSSADGIGSKDSFLNTDLTRRELQKNDSISAAQQKSQVDYVTNFSGWLERVSEIQNKINKNQIPLIHGEFVNQLNGNPSVELGKRLESNQIWWMSTNINQPTIYMYLSNNSEYPIRGLILEASQNSCENGTDNQVFSIESINTIQPFSETVLSFLPPKHLYSFEFRCLNIISAWN